MDYDARRRGRQREMRRCRCRSQPNFGTCSAFARVRYPPPSRKANRWNWCWIDTCWLWNGRRIWTWSRLSSCSTGPRCTMAPAQGFQMLTAMQSTAQRSARLRVLAAPRRFSGGRSMSRTSRTIRCGRITRIWRWTTDFALAGRRRIRNPQDRLLGTFAIYHKRARSPTKEEIESIRTITEHVARAIMWYRGSDYEEDSSAAVDEKAVRPALRLVSDFRRAVRSRCSDARALARLTTLLLEDLIKYRACSSVMPSRRPSRIA